MRAPPRSPKQCSHSADPTSSGGTCEWLRRRFVAALPTPLPRGRSANTVAPGCPAVASRGLRTRDRAPFTQCLQAWAPNTKHLQCACVRIDITMRRVTMRRELCGCAIGCATGARPRGETSANPPSWLRQRLRHRFRRRSAPRALAPPDRWTQPWARENRAPRLTSNWCGACSTPSRRGDFPALTVTLAP